MKRTTKDTTTADVSRVATIPPEIAAQMNGSSVDQPVGFPTECDVPSNAAKLADLLTAAADDLVAFAANELAQHEVRRLANLFLLSEDAEVRSAVVDANAIVTAATKTETRTVGTHSFSVPAIKDESLRDPLGIVARATVEKLRAFDTRSDTLRRQQVAIAAYEDEVLAKLRGHAMVGGLILALEKGIRCERDYLLRSISTAAETAFVDVLSLDDEVNKELALSIDRDGAWALVRWIRTQFEAKRVETMQTA